MPAPPRDEQGQHKTPKCRLIYLVCGTSYAVCLSRLTRYLLHLMSSVSCLTPHAPRIIPYTSRLTPSRQIWSHVLHMPYVLHTTRYVFPGARCVMRIASYVPCGSCRYHVVNGRYAVVNEIRKKKGNHVRRKRPDRPTDGWIRREHARHTDEGSPLLHL